MPPLTRQTTYSSLPPSPRYGEFNFGDESHGAGSAGVSGKGGLAAQDFEEVLGRLKAAAAPLKTAHTDDIRQRSSPAKDAAKSSAPVSGSMHHSGEGQTAGNLDPTKDKPRQSLGLSLWDLLKDEGVEEEWDGWLVEGKW
jgi:hypothetical protein